MKFPAALSVFLLAIAASAAPALADMVGGPARAVYGDTLEIDGRRFDLAGVDAPDPGSRCRWPDREIPCGDLARWALMDLIAGARVTCRPLGPPAANGAAPARCIADGFDIGLNMLHTGWALPAPGAGADYRATATGARASRHGLWRGGTVTLPDRPGGL